MPGKLKYTFIFGFLTFLGFVSSWSLSNQNSRIDSNHSILSKFKNSPTVSMEKHLMPLALVLQGPETYPSDPDAVVTLKANVRTPFPDFTAIHYSWLLPQDVELVKGQVSSEILNPVANQSYEIELQVRGFNNLDRKEISLTATTFDTNGAKLGNSVVLTSRPEDSMEHIAPVMMVKAQEFKASQSNERMPASMDDQ
jgi:hypothetical protein